MAKRIEARKQAESEPRTDREARTEREAVEAKPEPKKPVVSAVSNERRWRDAMSRMRPEDFAGSVGPARAEASADPSGTPAAPRMNFFERWVDIVQRAPPLPNRAAPADLAADARSAEPLVTPARVMLGLLVLILTLGFYELLRRPTNRRAD